MAGAGRSGERLDVVIVGAGPTGLTLAGQLQALGASFRIVDRQPDRVHESRPWPSSHAPWRSCAGWR